MQQETCNNNNTSVNNITTQTAAITSARLEETEAPKFVSPFKGPKIAWKKQFKRKEAAAGIIVNPSPRISDATTTTANIEQLQIDFNTNNDTSITSHHTLNLQEDKENGSQPETPKRKNLKRRVMSPLASCKNNSVDCEMELVTRQQCFSSMDNVQIVVKEPKGYAEGPRKLAKRIVMNRVDAIHGPPSTVKVALKFVF